MTSDVGFSLIFSVGLLVVFLDMTWQRYTTGRIDQKAAFHWLWRTLMVAAIFLLGNAIFLLATAKH